MANYAILKTDVQDAIKQNGNNEITGTLLQSTLLAMINSLGAGYQFMGVAVPATNPGTPDYRAFYLAGPGTYTNFNLITVPYGYIGILMYDNAWHLSTIQAGGSGPGESIVEVNGIAEMDTNTVGALRLGTLVADTSDEDEDSLYQVSYVDDIGKTLTHIHGDFVRRVRYNYEDGWILREDKTWIIPERDDRYVSEFQDLINEIDTVRAGMKVFVGDGGYYDCYTVVKRESELIILSYVDATKIAEARYTYDSLNDNWSVNTTTKMLN